MATDSKPALTYRNTLLVLGASAAVIVGLWAGRGVSLVWLALPVAAYVAAAWLMGRRASVRRFLLRRPSGAGRLSSHTLPSRLMTGRWRARRGFWRFWGGTGRGLRFSASGSGRGSSRKCCGQLDAAGHLLGNHTFTHSYFIDLFSTRRLRAELADTDAAIAAATGRRPRLFRPPYGVTTPNFARALRASGHACIGWSVRSLDTVATG